MVKKLKKELDTPFRDREAKSRLEPVDAAPPKADRLTAGQVKERPYHYPALTVRMLLDHCPTQLTVLVLLPARNARSR
jgi:hypothetical protein